MTTGEKLQKLRKSNNITQEQLSEILSVSRQSISKWEGDLAFPETDKLIALAKIYNCSVDYLLNIENNETTFKSEKTASEKSTYNTSKLPLLISCTFAILLSFVFFALDWVNFYDVENSKYVALSFYKAVFGTTGSENYLPLAGSFLFVNNFVILGLCIAYFIVDKLILSVFLRASYVLRVFFVFIFKDWATLPIGASALSGCYVHLIMDLIIVMLCFVFLFTTKEFKNVKTTSVMRKNIFAFSTFGLSVLFFLQIAIPVFYKPASIHIYNGTINYIDSRFESAFIFFMNSGNDFIVWYFLVLFFTVLTLLVLGLVYYFKHNTILKIIILVLTSIATVMFTFISIVYYPDHGEKLCKTFMLVTSLLLIVLIVIQARIMHLDKKELKEKQ